MNIEKYIFESMFSTNEQNLVFYELIWNQFVEDGFIITDTEGYEIDCVFKAVAMQNLLNEFIFRLYDSVNETEPENVSNCLEQLGYNEDDLKNYIEKIPDALCDGNSLEEDLKTMFDYQTEHVADKMLEDFSASAIFDLMFASTYDLEQDFTYDFEDSDELCAFIEANSGRLDIYKSEFPSLYEWIENGMIC